jgi:hypothetical protein
MENKDQAFFLSSLLHWGVQTMWKEEGAHGESKGIVSWGLSLDHITKKPYE